MIKQKTIIYKPNWAQRIFVGMFGTPLTYINSGKADVEGKTAGYEYRGRIYITTAKLESTT